MSRERPILMSGSLVRAVLDGRKTQTRRLAKEKHFAPELHRRALQVGVEAAIAELPRPLQSPYGQVGDRLWVRETWAPLGDVMTEVMGRPRLYRADADLVRDDSGDRVGWWCGDVFVEGARRPFRWTPSIRMPKWASRLSLVITDVRVERLQDISEEDAIAEGVNLSEWEPRGPDGRFIDREFGYREAFSWLWGSVYGADAWVANPWVWAISFERVKS